ncbi:MAG: glutamine-hydrolyzing carbamoyl-phosphate synthase small subunit [Bacteroidota bacterium]
MNGHVAKLALENGLIFTGVSVGAEGETAGEVVFNTGMTGYQEVLTDPSYAGQIVTMTYPLIGNTGINDEDVESWKPHVAGFIMHEYSRFPSNWRMRRSLQDYLIENRIVAIAGIDTRKLTRIIRTAGAMRGVISTVDFDENHLIKRAQAIPPMVGSDFVKVVTCGEPYRWIEREPLTMSPLPPLLRNCKPHRVAVVDYGVKWNILRRLSMYGAEMTILPATATADEILATKPEGIFLSNGPGDPEAVTYAVETVKRLLSSGVPMFGICLGHQILALALGGKTYKLKFGHRGANHPVKNLKTGTISITTQNHGFAVDWDSMDERFVELTHVNLYDHTVEGFRHRELPLFSVQYHPEASPGPHDSDDLFAQFIALMDGGNFRALK